MIIFQEYLCQICCHGLFSILSGRLGGDFPPLLKKLAAKALCREGITISSYYIEHLGYSKDLRGLKPMVMFQEKNWWFKEKLWIDIYEWEKILSVFVEYGLQPNIISSVPHYQGNQILNIPYPSGCFENSDVDDSSRGEVRLYL
ncbi:unnamed protein product [Ambrosiozyma monospora]|uniref:Unnamed protein product n=1 Tax=Ambrosiozyma monospora TaxID=43982 RepID=A0ACB5TUG8_AMBMO|nr:unnamed protein product [Ambrosiozyma monospora]